MPDNTCIVCGRIIPEGRHICLACGDYDDMQTFQTKIRTNGDLVRSMTNEQITKLGVQLGIIPAWFEKAALIWLESEVPKP